MQKDNYHLRISSVSYDGTTTKVLDAHNITLVCAYNIIKLYSEYKGMAIDLSEEDNT